MANQALQPDRPQPRPLRVIAAITGLLTLIIGGLPTLGVPLSPEAIGWLSGVVGALSAVAVALLGEHYVTPVRTFGRSRRSAPPARQEDSPARVARSRR